MVTVLHEQRESGFLQSKPDPDHLWLDAAQIEQATGWQWKPEGLCRDDTCVPLPRGAHDLVRGDRLDLAALWRHMGQPVVHDGAGDNWVLGTGAAQRAQALATLQAPDFELPDLQGQRHRLSDFRGKKVFLATWASW